MEHQLAIKRDEIQAEHLLERAPEDLRMGWKAWIAAHGPVKEGAAAAAVVPAAGITLVFRDSAGSLHELACLSSGAARRSIPSFAEILLKPLLTPDKWTIITIFCIFAEYDSNMQEYAGKYAEHVRKYAAICIKYAEQYTEYALVILCMLCILQYADYAEYGQCSIFCILFLHIRHICFHFFTH